MQEADRRAVLSAAARRRFKKREVVFHEGDPGDSLHLIAKGRVTVHVTSPLGDESLLALMGPGEAFGELALITTDARRTATITTIEPTETLVLHRDAFEDVRRRHASVDRLLVSVLGRQVDRLSKQVNELTFFTLEMRVLRRLAELAQIFASSAEQSNIEIPLNQSDIAGLAGATRPRVNEALRKAEEAGLIELGRGRIVVKEAASLRKRAKLR